MHWREDVLTLPHCQAQVGGRQGLIFVGPRIKMGIYEGVPTRVTPHTTTGSADYFGPLVNRYNALLMGHLTTCVCVSWWIAEQESEILHSIGKPSLLCFSANNNIFLQTKTSSCKQQCLPAKNIFLQTTTSSCTQGSDCCITVRSGV